MMTMCYRVQIGELLIGAIDKVEIRKSVENLADTAVITLPATYINKAIMDVEEKIKAGYIVEIKLGYDNNLVNEFNGYVNRIASDEGSLKIECEDALYKFRKDIKDVELKNIKVANLLKHVVKELKDKSIKINCTFDFSYGKFVIKDATAYDVLKKLQEELKANVYFRDQTLHVHPQYEVLASDKAVIYDFAINVEKSELKYKNDKERKFLIEVESVGKDNKRIVVKVGSTGGDKRSIKVYGVTDKASLKKRGEEALKQMVSDGLEGDFKGWLVPYCEPTYKVKLIDRDYPKKTGVYYVLATEVSFSSAGGERKVIIGRKMEVPDGK